MSRELTAHVPTMEEFNKMVNEKKNNPLDTQVGGNHYKSLPIQVVEYNFFNDIPYIEGNIIKHITRWRTKNGINGIQDLEKAKHYIELLIELEKRKQTKEKESSS